MASHSYQLASECLNVYQNTFGPDNFYTEHSLSLIRENGPSISLICIDSDAASVDSFIEQQQYRNLDVFYVSSTDCIEEILTYFQSVDSKYVCFFEANHKYNDSRLVNLACLLNNSPQLDGILCTRNFIDANGTIIAHPDLYQGALYDKVYLGSQFLEISIKYNINLYGNLSTLILSTQHIKQIPFTFTGISPSMQMMALFHQLISQAELYFINLPLVSTILRPYENPSALEEDYKNYLKSFCSNEHVKAHAMEKLNKSIPACSDPIKKIITFFYTDKGEYYNVKPIADEAEKRGYQVIFTDNIKEKAEIGIYCQHVCFPENSKFSVILLHDLAQGHLRWPNIWEWERWDKYDLGILPCKSWAERWSQCACQYYANPRCGVFDFGYPKGDLTFSETLKNRAAQLRQELNLKYDTSILYAPSWENDGKEHDFISSLSGLKVNLLIKQAHFPAEMANIIENIRQMRALHEGNYPNVYYIEPEESIQTALILCDYVVSDESSVMSEAIMFDKLSISVTDWLIPDTTPSRNAYFPLDYVIKCRKSQLYETVNNLLTSPEMYEHILEKGRRDYCNSGHVCKNIMDAIEFYTTPEADRTPSSFCHKKLTSKYTPCSLWN